MPCTQRSKGETMDLSSLQQSPAMIASVVLLVCVLLVGINSLVKKKLNLPPSPPRLPLLGNLHLMKGVPFLLFSKLSEKYGPIFTLWFGPRPLIIINDEAVTREALTLRGKQLAGRPRRYTGSLYSRNFKGIVLSSDDSALKYRRRLAHQILRVFGDQGSKLEGLIVEECKDLVRRLGQKCEEGNPVDIRDELSVAALNVICALVFGSRYEVNDLEFKEIIEANEWFLEGIQSSPIIDGFPLLRFFPFRQIQLMKNFVKVRDKVLEAKLRNHEDTFDAANIRDFTDALIHASQDNSAENADKASLLSHDQRLMMMGDLFLAGAETTATSLNWGILYLTKWPEVQKLVQEELDRVLEEDKQPNMVDRTKLPYLEATEYEILRLSSVAPLGVPHTALEDTTVAGYDIPKGTTVIFNYYAVNHNSNVWKDPNSFCPERFLEEDGKFIPPSKGFLPFSMGRRACIGENLAKMELHLFLCHLLREFEFKADPQNSDDLIREGKNGATWSPLPYKVLLTRRRVQNS